MYWIKTLEWDSAFFNKKIGELMLSKTDTTEFSNKPHAFDLLIFKSSKNKNITIDGFKNTFQETKYVFSKKISDIKKNETNIKINDFDTAPLKATLFYNLAYESGKYSRFKLDPFYKNEDFYNLYNKWIDNSINKTYADKIFYILDNQKVIGLVTLKNNDTFATIGLIAVAQSYQGKGLGKQLINKVENYCYLNALKTLKIPTQKKNTNACNFYKKLNYNIVEKTFINHLWNLKNDTI